MKNFSSIISFTTDTSLCHSFIKYRKTKTDLKLVDIKKRLERNLVDLEVSLRV